MSNPTFCNGVADVRWLRETHLAGVIVPPFRSFMLYGNEDSPVELHLFEARDPKVVDSFLRVTFDLPPIYCTITPVQGRPDASHHRLKVGA